MDMKSNDLAYRVRKQSGDSGRGWLLVLLLAVGLAGCNLPARETAPTPTQDLNQLATLTQQALEKEIPAATQAPTATLPPSPTATQEESSNSPETPLPSNPREIKFRAGGTIAFFQGEINAGGRLVFTFQAGAGQNLIARVSSNDQDVYFEILGLEDGRVLVPLSDLSSSINTILPGTQVYQITLASPTANVYFLSVEVPADLSVAAGQGPVTVDGHIEVLQDFHPSVFTWVRYLLDLEAGTVLNVDLQSEALEDLTLALTGKEDGVPYLRHVVKSEAIQDFQVMASQPYYLDVYSISGESADFSLVIEVDG
jgi:hypothetical protein